MNLNRQACVGCSGNMFDNILDRQKLSVGSLEKEASNDVSILRQVTAAKQVEVVKTRKSLTKKELLIQELRASLEKKLLDAEATKSIPLSFQTCKELNITNYDDTCSPDHSKCLNQNIPEDLNERLEKLVFPENMPIPDRYIDILNYMRKQITTKQDLIIVHALSSNHFNETQYMLKDLHSTAFPVLKNFTLIIYDLGLKESELILLKKHCRCTVVKFPFEKFPTYFRTLKCFAWKIFVIAAHYEQANVTIWIDASISTRNVSGIPLLIDRARSRGIQQRCNRGMTHNPYHTLPQMFEAFGDSPCAHLSFRQCEGGYGVYHNEPLIRHAVIKPWVACASREFCICPVNQGAVQYCYPLPKRTVGICMRNDQSAISIILASLFREKFDHFVHDTTWLQKTDRGQKNDYFWQLEVNSTVKTVDNKPVDIKPV